jgi:hypothetical protein
MVCFQVISSFSCAHSLTVLSLPLYFNIFLCHVIIFLMPIFSFPLYTWNENSLIGYSHCSIKTLSKVLVNRQHKTRNKHQYAFATKQFIICRLHHSPSSSLSAIFTIHRLHHRLPSSSSTVFTAHCHLHHSKPSLSSFTSPSRSLTVHCFHHHPLSSSSASVLFPSLFTSPPTQSKYAVSAIVHRLCVAPPSSILPLLPLPLPCLHLCICICLCLNKIPPPLEVVNPAWNPHGTCSATAQTLRETFPPPNWKVTSVQFADYYYIPCPYRTCTP